MSFLKRPFQFGKLSLSCNVFCAPLAGCSDLPYRRMTSQFQPGLIYTEMVKMDALIRHDPHTFRLLDFEGEMHPIGAQICGSKAEYAAKSAKIIEDLGFDTIDLNCGCPVDKVTKDGSGSAMLKTPDLIGETLSNMLSAVKIPVTVKIRAGWDDDQINCVEITRIAEQAGATAICIHGRTREQGYKGFANWDHIRDCKKAATSILVVGNGDLFDPASVQRMYEHTGCDAFLLSRGTMGQPWLAEDVKRFYNGEPLLPQTPQMFRDQLMAHFAHITSYQTERKAVLDMRRVGCYYLRRGRGTKALKEALNRAKSTQEIRVLFEQFPWHETDFSVSEQPCEAEC